MPWTRDQMAARAAREEAQGTNGRKQAGADPPGCRGRGTGAGPPGLGRPAV